MPIPLVVTKRDAKVNGTHHGDSPKLKPIGIQIATKPLPGPTNRQHRELIGVKTMSINRVLPVFTMYLNDKLQRRLSDAQQLSNKVIKNDSNVLAMFFGSMYF